MTIEELLIKEESFVRHCYKDHLGFWTIGYGRMIDERKDGGISRQEGFTLLLNDIDECRNGLDEKIPWWRDLNVDRQTVLTAMAYQMGVGGLMKFHRTLKAAKAGDFKATANGMRASLWARQTPGRAERMAKAMESGGF